MNKLDIDGEPEGNGAYDARGSLNEGFCPTGDFGLNEGISWEVEGNNG